jgi:hypothetical protein
MATASKIHNSASSYTGNITTSFTDTTASIGSAYQYELLPYDMASGIPITAAPALSQTITMLGVITAGALGIPGALPDGWWVATLNKNDITAGNSVLSLSFGTPFAPSNLVRRIGAVRRDVVLRFGNIQRIMPAWN